INMRSRFMSELENLERQVKSLEKKVKELTREIQKLKSKKPQTKEIERDVQEMELEKKGLNQLIKSLSHERNTFNFLTDCGLVPNYAFPEAGVTLNTIILKDRSPEEESGYSKSIKYKYERPSYAAI